MKVNPQKQDLTEEEIIYNNACLFALLTISVSMELFFTMVVIYYYNWNKNRGALNDQKKRVIMLGAPLIYKKYFIN